MPLYDYPADGAVVAPDALREWTVEVVGRLGTPHDISTDVADVLVAADLRGIASHGTARLPIYASLIEGGVLDPVARPTQSAGAAALTLWDAHNGWGPHTGRVLMDDCVDRAQRLGMAAAVTQHANHYGIAGWYAMRAAARGVIGVSMTNSSPLVAPTRGVTPMLGTNPIAVAAPAGRFGTLVLDMATSTITWGRVEVAARRGAELPPGVALDKRGNPTTSPDAVLGGGCLLPLGGPEETAGYKGYGLALIVDLLTGVLASANFGARVIGFSLIDGPSNLGQLFMAIDPHAVDPGSFEARVETLLDDVTHAKTAPGAPGPILIPGQPEAQREAEQRRTGIVLDRAHYESLVSLGEHLGIESPAVGTTRQYGD